MVEKKWLVTVEGIDHHYNPAAARVSKVITLPENETPVEWFLSKPTCYYRFEFVPVALIGFWEVK